MKLQSRLEQEEEAKAALLSRIQRLTKLILVSTKSSPSSRLSHRTSIRRRHSLVEEELAYLLHRKHDLILDEENAELIVSLDESVENNSDALKEEKKTKKPGILNWLKPRRRDSISGALTSPSDKSSGARSISSPSTPPADYPTESRHSHSTLTECKSAEFSPGARQHQEINEDTFLQQESPLVEITRLNEQIKFKNDQIKLMEDKIATSAVSSHHKMSEVEETRVKARDNRVLQEQLNQKALEIEKLKLKVGDLTESKEQLESRNKKLAEDSSYAKGLASAAEFELKALSEEVAKLMNHNEKLASQNNNGSHLKRS